MSNLPSCVFCAPFPALETGFHVPFEPHPAPGALLRAFFLYKLREAQQAGELICSARPSKAAVIPAQRVFAPIAREGGLPGGASSDRPTLGKEP